MELKERVKNFKKTMNTWIWQYRRDAVTEVRAEACKTCNKINIKHKGKPVRLRRMERIYDIIKKFYGREKANKHIRNAILRSGVDLTDRNRTLTKDEQKLIRTQLHKFDLIDGRFATLEQISQKDQYINHHFKKIPQELVDRLAQN